mmetsp:Transcript_15107/g.12824  ORF Transcript_15107/g.12824 Transcript_15107/m.12824 type:complete len:152 (+) Transcript_15107:122-577(+)
MINNSADPFRRTIGYSHNKTNELLSVKLEIAKKRDRFRKPLGTPTNDKEKFLKSDSYSLDIGSRSAGILPEWVDYYEESLDKLNKVADLNKDIARLIAQKIKVQFNSKAQELESEIATKTTEATKLLHVCEENHRKICDLGSLATDSKADR